MRRTLLSLVIVTLAYGVYALCVVPLVEPNRDHETLANDAQSFPTTSTVTDQFVRELSPLFPEGAWELDHPRVLRSEQVTFLLKEFEELEDGRLHVRPCTVVHYGDNREQGAIGTTIMQAPQGAILEFDKPVRLSSADFDAKPVAAVLVGGIRIVRLGEKPDEDLELVTSNVRITKKQIWTPDRVSFLIGDIQGDGSNLLITRALGDNNQVPEQDSDQGQSEMLQNLGTIELQQVRELSFVSRQGDLFGSLAQTPVDRSGEPQGPTQVTVRCQGPMIVDLNRMKATLEDQVVVSQQRTGQPPDTMTASHLWMDFAHGPSKAVTITDAAEPSREDQPSSSVQVARIVAEGAPVVIDAKSMMGYVEGQRLEYNFLQRELKLFGENPFSAGTDPSSRQVRLRLPQYQLEAPSIEFHNDEDRTKWELHAEGNGRFQGTLDQSNPMQVQWTQGLHLVPRQGQQVLLVQGNVQAQLPQAGAVQADEIEVWLVPVSTQIGTRLDGTPVMKSSTEPTRLVSRSAPYGKTQIDSPQLRGTLAGMEIFFEPNPHPPLQPGGIAFDSPFTAPGVASAAQPGATLPATKQFQIDGGMLTAWVDPKSRDVHRIVVNGHSKITEANVPSATTSGQQGSSQRPMQLEGDQIDVTIVRGEAIAELTGSPANVVSSDLELAGRTIRFDVQQNVVHIPGTGSLTVTVANDFLGKAVNASQQPAVGDHNASVMPKVLRPIKITWQDGLRFDGRRATVSGQVRAAGDDLSFAAETATLELEQRVDFSDTNLANTQPRLRHVSAQGGVTFAVQLRDEQNQPKSYQQMFAPQMELDFVSGDLYAAGPGRLSFTSAERRLPGFGNQPPARQEQLSQDHRSQDTASGDRSTNALTHLGIAYRTQLEGNMNLREIHLSDNIRMWLGPVDSWTESVDPTERGTLRKDDVWISCHELFVLESPTAVPTEQRKPIELLARGEAYVEGQLFAAKGQEIKYAEEKDMLTFEGDVDRPAQLWQRNSPNDRGTSQGRVRRIRYWPKSEKAFLEGVLNFDVSAIPSPGQR